MTSYFRTKLQAGEGQVLTEGLYPANVLIEADGRNRGGVRVWFCDEMETPLATADPSAFPPATVLTTIVPPGGQQLIKARRIAIANQAEGCARAEPSNPEGKTLSVRVGFLG